MKSKSPRRPLRPAMPRPAIAPESRSLKIALISLGCAKNLVDSEIMLGSLARQGITPAQTAEEADVVIVNTCGFIEGAKQESIDAVLRAQQLRRTGRCRALIMAGCLSQRYPRELQKELTELDAIIGLNEVPQIGEIVRELLGSGGQAPRLSPPIEKDHRDGCPTLYWSGPAKYIPDFAAPRLRLTPPHLAYVKIAEGCNHPCTFCSIPRIRGRHRSRPLEDVLSEIRALVRDGVREINLISQDTTFYGRDLAPAGLLAPLLRGMDRIEGRFWVRLLYTHPAHWTDELIDAIAGSAKVCRYVDLPLQHISDDLLRRMRRETSGDHIRRLIQRIRAGIPGVALRTTFIVGFPGETEQQFRELLEFIEETRFERVGVFVYSREDHTPAGSMAGQVSARVKQERRRRAMALQQQISLQNNRRCIGRTMTVLVEKKAGPGCIGRSHADAPEIDGTVRVSGPVTAGEFVEVRITRASAYDLQGKVAPAL